MYALRPTIQIALNIPIICRLRAKRLYPLDVLSYARKYPSFGEVRYFSSSLESSYGVLPMM